MSDLVIVYWRDIPAQVIVGRGRRAAKQPLPERFEQAIDRAAMKANMTGTDAYLSQWRKSDPEPVSGDPEQAARDAAARIDAEFDPARLRALIDNLGHAPAPR